VELPLVAVHLGTDAVKRFRRVTNASGGHLEDAVSRRTGVSAWKYPELMPVFSRRETFVDGMLVNKESAG
jgi:hypothetical protein